MKRPKRDASKMRKRRRSEMRVHGPAAHVFTEKAASYT